MHGVASTAPEVEAAGSEPDLSVHTGIRPIAPLLPEQRAAAIAAEQATAPSCAAAQLLPPGTCVDGKYIICDVLGTGGCATVYAAEQVGLKRVVAFKLYPLGADTSPALRERFEREAELLARVQHENVVAVFDSGCLDDGSPYLVVQRLKGESLAARLALAGPLPVEEAAELALQVASALEALSAAGITHRDIKPDNLVLDPVPEGRTLVKLVDFGIALAGESEAGSTSEGLMGTPHYMAPEQISGGPIDARCDLYALGATFYEMLTGRTPHNGESLSELARAIMFAPITPVRVLRPDCPAELEAIVMQALAREPRQRFASARALKQALERWRAGLTEPPGSPAASPLEDTLRVPTRRPPPRRAPRRVAWGLGVAAALSLSLLATGWPRDERAAAGQAATTGASLGVRESAVLELMLQTGPLARGALLHTSAAAAELLLRAQSTARALLELVQQQTAIWESQVRGQPLHPGLSPSTKP